MIETQKWLLGKLCICIDGHLLQFVLKHVTSFEIFFYIISNIKQVVKILTFCITTDAITNFGKERLSCIYV